MKRVYRISIFYKVRMSPFNRKAYTSVKEERIFLSEPDEVEKTGSFFVKKIHQFHKIDYVHCYEFTGFPSFYWTGYC